MSIFRSISKLAPKRPEVVVDGHGLARTIPRRFIGGIEELLQAKIDLINMCKSTQSLRDYGGLYYVNGRFLLEPAIHLKVDFASMIDVTPLPEFDVAVQQAKRAHPSLEVEFVHADFGDAGLYHRLQNVDTSILFEVLLHQPNYVDVMGWVASKTNQTICVAQPCMAEGCFTMPAATTLLQFWPDEIKQQFRAVSHWPVEPKSERFESKHWMWGQTTSHLVAVMHGFGWDLHFAEFIEGIYSENWVYPLLTFQRRSM